jgi:phosphopantothenoylcysteine decarboxylase/phosphopantothenate--cysteine ligase
VRYITNHSTGKMGYAIAENAMLRGADVTLVSGPCAVEPPMFVNLKPVISAQDMYDAVIEEEADADIIIMTAAVADYRPSTVSDEKIKKKDGDLSIPLTRTKDILATVGASKSHQFLCGFSMETEHMLENSRAKIAKKNLDMIVANNLKVNGAGFGTDTNVITIITPDSEQELPIMSKKEAADCILDEIMKRI